VKQIKKNILIKMGKKYNYLKWCNSFIKDTLERASINNWSLGSIRILKFVDMRGEISYVTIELADVCRTTQWN
jgi:hypothetical protein